MWKTAKQERGQVLMLVAVLLTGLLGLVGLVVDAGHFYAERRQVQNAADQAALAADRILFENGTSSAAVSAALDYAQANGYEASQVTVYIPPLSGEHVGDAKYVEVIINEQPQTLFIHVLAGGGDVQGRGVAGFVLYPEPYAIIVLDPDDCAAFRQQGNATLNVSGGGVMVNSNCPADALSKIGAGNINVDYSIDVHGGSSVGGSGSVSPSPETVPWTVSDPLASLVPPPRGAPAPGSTGTAAVPKTWKHTGSSSLTLQPGTYYGGFEGNCSCTITLQPGIYIMSGGGFNKAGSTNFVGDEVMIYVTTNPENPIGDGAPKPFDLEGSGALDLSPMTTGTYYGITLWQDEAITTNFKMRGSNDLLSGLVYAPGAQLDISGDSDFGTIQLVVNTFSLSGNAPLNLTYGSFRDFEAPKVSLVE